MQERTKANLAGIGALFSWAFMTSLLRMVTESLGTMLATAIVYTLGAIALFVVNPPTRLSEIPRRYLFACGPLFVSYEIILAFAIGAASSRAQVLEVSILNYLWPTMLVFLIMLTSSSNRLGTLTRLVPGTVLAVAGIVLCVGGDDLLAGATLFSSALTNPLPDALALLAAVIWAFYSVLTPRLSNGGNATAYFFAAIALLLWVAFAAQGFPVASTALPLPSVFALSGTTLSVTLGYALWNFGIAHGDMKLLSSASYVAPLLSCLVSALLLNLLPTAVFWVGAVSLVAGTLLSFFALNGLPAPRHRPGRGRGMRA